MLDALILVMLGLQFGAVAVFGVFILSELERMRKALEGCDDGTDADGE